MKIIFIGILLIASAIAPLDAQKIKSQDTGNIIFTVENTINLNWDAIQHKWVNYSITEYSYTDTLKYKTLTKEYSSGIPLRQSLFNYDLNNYLLSISSQKFLEGNWYNTSKSTYILRDSGVSDKTVIQIWDSTSWVNHRRYNYMSYNSDGLLTRYDYQFWEDEEWTDFSVDYWIYNSLNQLIERRNIKIDGTNYYMITYSIDEQGFRQSLTTQWWRNNQWENSWRRLYTYDNCGNLLSVIKQNYVDEEWINNSKKDYYYKVLFKSDFKNNKVPVCHKGHTIWVSENAVPAHLNHGDCIGECMEEKNPNRHRERESNSTAGHKSSTFEGVSTRFAESDIQVYPNPVREQFILNLGFNKQNIRRVEILDISGRVVRKVIVSDESEMVIHRGKLKKGMYFIRLVGDEVITEKIIFE